MGWSDHHQQGLIYYSPNHCYRGYTLFGTNRGGYDAYLIDMEGRICHKWHSDEGIVYAYLLPYGNLLLRTHAAKEGGNGSEKLGGASGALLELDWDSNVVWEYRNPKLHHDFERLVNGNTLTLLWEPIAQDLSQAVRGGYYSEDDPNQMFGDVVQEIEPNGTVVWEWRSWEHLDVEEDIICPLEARKAWAHQNALNITDDGDLLVSYRLTSTVGIVDKSTGEFKWKWGPGSIYHQHHPTYLPNGHVQIFDNGGHRRGPSRSRIIEVDISNNEIVWEYTGTPDISFYSYHISSAERQPNGNVVICEGAPGRLFEVTPQKEIVWEYISPFYGVVDGVNNLESLNSSFRAHRYGYDYSGLKGMDLDPNKYGNMNRLF